METKIEQGRGNRNKEYWTATFEWPRGASHFCFRGKRDWMPKHIELATILETVLAIEPPDKRAMLNRRFQKALARGLAAPVEHNGREEAEQPPSDEEEEPKKRHPANVMCDYLN